MTAEGRLQRAERIRQKHVDEARELLAHVDPARVDLIVHVGLGSYDEAPAIAEHLPNRQQLAIEPLLRYQSLPTYPGDTIRAVATNRDVPSVHIADRYGKTSLHAPYPCRDCDVETVPGVRLDTVVPRWLGWTGCDRILLWMDCEGGEAAAIMGAHGIMPQVNYAIVEHRDNPECLGWCSTRDVVELLELHGLWKEATYKRRAGVYDSVFKRVVG